MHPYIVFFGYQLQSYYVCAAAAGIAGVLLSARFLRKKKQGAWAVILPLLTLIAALLGARLLNFITNPRAYSDGFAVWTLSYRKLSLMGGLIAGTAAIMLYCILRKEKLAVITDAFTPPAAAGIIILKLGCFLNGCCCGKPTEGPLGMVFPANASKYSFLNSLKVISAKSPVVHPTQLYELAGAALALLIAVLLPRLLKLKDGSRAAIFAAVFSAVRWIVLPLRELPYDLEIVAVLYPCLYAALICFSLIFGLACNIGLFGKRTRAQERIRPVSASENTGETSLSQRR